MRQKFLLLILLVISVFRINAQQTTTVVASHRYEHAYFVERMLVGINYRDLWSMSITVKVFHLNSEKGGLIPQELGGGMQTKSLHLEDRNGQKWVLRSIDKEVSKAMEAMGIKNKAIRHFSQQMISAADPFGPLTLPPMAEAIGI